MILQFIVLFVLILFSEILAHNCFENHDKFFCKFGTLTPYRYVANYNESLFIYPGENNIQKFFLICSHFYFFVILNNI